MNKRFYNIYQYIAFFIIFPLTIVVWYREFKNPEYVFYMMCLPIITAYVIPALGTNVAKLWEFDTKFKAGGFRIYHGFVLGSATSLFGFMFYKISPEYANWLNTLCFALVCGAFIGFWNWLYDIYAVKCGFIKVYNKPAYENKSPHEIVFDYAPVYFYVFGFIYAFYIKALEYYYPLHPHLILVILINLASLILPTLIYALISYKNNGTFGIFRYIPKAPFDLAFIRPSMYGAVSGDAMYPLVFAIAKSITPKDFSVAFYDERVEEIPENINTNTIIMSVETFSAKRAYKLTKKYRTEGKKVIMGGFHPSACPNEALQYADSVVIGEIETVWVEILNDIKNDTLKRKYEAKPADFSSTEYDYSIFKAKKYNPIGLVQFSRGCKFACDFCSVHAFFKETIRTKPIDKIVKEIKNVKENFIFFIDDNLFSNEKEAISLFKALIPLKKKWCCQISIDAAKNEDMLKLMKQSGCALVLIGFESLDVENLKQMGKVANLKNINYKQIIKNIYDAGIMIYGTFVIGYDNDTKETAEKLADFAIENKFAIANFNPLMPMPDTKLYKRMKNEGRLSYEKWWLDDNYSYGNSMIIPKNMTEKELMESCRNARYKFNTFENIFKRLLNPKANFRSLNNIFLFLLANLISRKEILNKQGRKLGGK